MAAICVPFFILINMCLGFTVVNNACENYNDYFVKSWSRNCYYNPDVSSDFVTVIKRNGYTVKNFTITTQDGYILTLFRIPARNSDLNHQPIFLMHGILTNPSVWVHLGNKSLAFNLADRGYDVWLGTLRGSDFAKFHKQHPISSKAFWDFSLDSLAYFDVGDQLKFIAGKIKRRRSIIYVGHSVGSTLAFLYASGYPSEARNLLSGIVALAPVFYLTDVPILKSLQTIADSLERELERKKMYGLFYDKSVNINMVSQCSNYPHFCIKMLQVFGNVTEQFEPSNLLLFFSNFPSGVSFQVLKHCLQIFQNKNVRRFDFGSEKNLKYYRSIKPSKYDPRYIKVPMFLFYGDNDPIASKKNVMTFYRQLQSSRIYLIKIPEWGNLSFNHMDFLMAKDIKTHLYPKLLQMIKNLH